MFKNLLFYCAYKTNHEYIPLFLIGSFYKVKLNIFFYLNITLKTRKLVFFNEICINILKINNI